MEDSFGTDHSIRTIDFDINPEPNEETKRSEKDVVTVSGEQPFQKLDTIPSVKMNLFDDHLHLPIPNPMTRRISRRRTGKFMEPIHPEECTIKKGDEVVAIDFDDGPVSFHELLDKL